MRGSDEIGARLLGVKGLCETFCAIMPRRELWNLGSRRLKISERQLLRRTLMYEMRTSCIKLKIRRRLAAHYNLVSSCLRTYLHVLIYYKLSFTSSINSP